MAKIITMGEIMLRLAPAGYERFVQAERFDAVYGGGEANVAVSLANYGHDAYFISKLPKHEIGQAALNALRRYGVNTSYIARGGERVGIYFLENGVSMRPSKVIYDRAGSSIAEAKISDFDFDRIFSGAQWFHFTGITPAISEASCAVLEEALKAAKRHQVPVSCDLNYRKKLWTPEKAQQTMRHLMQYVDVCIGNEEDAEKCLGYKAGSDVTQGDLELSGYERIFKQMKEAFGFKYIVTSLRESHSASDNGWSGLAYDGKEFYHSKNYDLRIVDRVGGGDAFAAGFIHGLFAYDHNFKKALEFAVAASALKHTVLGDFNQVSTSEVETLMGGDASGRVQR